MNGTRFEIAFQTFRGIRWRVVEFVADRDYEEPHLMRELEWRRDDESYWHTDDSYLEETGREIPETMRAWLGQLDKAARG